MDQLVLKTKIVLPRHRNDVLRRTRVLSILEEFLSQRLLLVVAPAGYGKTYLLVDLADVIELPVCWYSVDDLDEDPVRFFAHFCASLSRQFPDFGHQSSAMLQSYAAGQASVDQLLVTVVNELHDMVDDEFVLMIDDYHLVDGVNDIGRFMSEFLEHIGAGTHVIVASRKLLSLPNLALLVARSEVGGLDHEDLAFTAAEIQAVIAQNFRHQLSEAQVADLLDLTEGWITGLLLSVQSKVPELVRQSRLLRASGVNLYDYLAQQVLDRQSSGMRSFLLRTSVLEEFDAELCEQIFDDDWCVEGQTAQGMIDEVLTQGLFALPVGDNGYWIRYHRLFQEFLLHCYRRENPQEHEATVRRMASWLTVEHQWERARQLYQSLQDQEAIALLIVQAGPAYLRSGRTPVLNKWIGELSSHLQTTYPILLGLRAVSLVQIGQVDLGFRLLEQAVALLEQRKEVGLAQALVWRAVVHRLRGDYERSLADVDRAHGHIVDVNAPDYARQDVLIHILKNRGLCYWALGKLDAAIEELRTAQALAETLGDTQTAATIGMDIGSVSQDAGQFASAQASLERAAEALRGMNNVVNLCNCLNSLGVLYHRQGRYDESIISLGEAVRLAQRIGSGRVICVAFASIGDLLLDLECWPAADAAYSRAISLAEDQNYRSMRLYILVQQVYLACLMGASRDAYRLLDIAGNLLSTQGTDYEWGIYQLAIGRYYLLRSSAEKSCDPVSDALQRLCTCGYLREALVAALSLVVARNAVDEKTSPVKLQDAFTKACELYSTLEHPRPALLGVIAIADQLREFARATVTNDTFLSLVTDVDELRRELPSMRRSLRYHMPTSLSDVCVIRPQVAIRAFGRMEVVAQDRFVSSSDWQTTAARNLFFCFLAHPAGLTRDEVGALFWPDCSPGQLRGRFKNAIYRLRSALGTDAILYEHNVYSVNPELDYTYDVEEFLTVAAASGQYSEPDKRIEALHAAIDLYRGPYLPEVAETWAWIERERLARLYIETLLKLGQSYFDCSEYTSAMEICRRMLAEDSCCEDAHRLAMQIHAATGNRAGVARQFDICCQALLEEVDAPPSEQTEALFARLMD